MSLFSNKSKPSVYSCIALCVSLFIVSGCTLREIKKQAELADNVGVLKGKVIVKSNQKGPVFVLRFRNNNGVLILENKMIASSEGKYQFGVLPGEYTVFAFIDVNKDGEFQRGKEHGNYHIGPLTFKVEANETVVVKTLVIAGDPPLPPADLKIEIDQFEILKNIGKVTSLDDPKFTRNNYSMGMWRPLDFLKQVGGGLMMLQKYERRKTPVIFVHGISGGPTDLQNVINSLDRHHFQPWILYYPSGVRLGMISDYFVQAVQKLQNRHGFDKFMVISHSMGGLVTRSFIKKYTERFPAHAKDIQLVMTINSPMGGMPSAAASVKMSPIIVASWRDVASNSDFIKDINTFVWPSHIPYYLVFSYKDGKGDDGVVSLNSQIPFKLQSEAARIYGFNNDHVGTLNDKRFFALFNSILAKRVK